MDKLLTVRIDQDLLQDVKMATVSNETTIAEVVREALRKYVASNPGRGGSRAPKAKAAARKPAKAPAKRGRK